jgi:acyl carrier protein
MSNIENSPADILSKLLSERRPRPAIGIYEAPESELEKSISDTWSEVLRIDQIGRHDSIFALGGDSLHMVQIASRLRKKLGIEISAWEFFDNPTISGLALRVQSFLEVEKPGA